MTSHSPHGRWWASVPPNRWPDDDDFRAQLAALWHPAWGDRRQEIVVIGVGMDEAAIRGRFDACLTGLDDAEAFEPERYRHLADPFPVWRAAEQAA
jgi:hypothetical protein